VRRQSRRGPLVSKVRCLSLAGKARRPRAVSGFSPTTRATPSRQPAMHRRSRIRRKGALRVCAPVGPPSVLGISAQTSHIGEDTQERRRLAHPSSGQERDGLVRVGRECSGRRAVSGGGRLNRARESAGSGAARGYSTTHPDGPTHCRLIAPGRFVPAVSHRRARVGGPLVCESQLGLREDLWLVSCNRRLTLTESADENDDGYSGPLGGLIATHAWRYWRGFSTICNRRFASRGSGWPGSRRALYRHLWC
jgi:hypothetical protein